MGQKAVADRVHLLAGWSGIGQWLNRTKQRRCMMSDRRTWRWRGWNGGAVRNWAWPSLWHSAPYSVVRRCCIQASRAAPRKQKAIDFLIANSLSRPRRSCW